MDERMFPIQGDRYGMNGNRRAAGQVPWAVAIEAYKVYSAMYGTGQSIERIAERGGFGWSELVWLLRGGHGDCVTLPFVE